ncbi:TRAP transporter substrate-binding protein [Roseobacter sp. MH60115]|uniref:TRAP transporter substrate-binding protein n=1 Tax=Roseobacter sp. MH60115 TaxID=2785324 RepID=UPI0018A27589|nr:TRAP transporter substrate-binding protein [Roseobacter sp. MH60115]
MIRFSTVAVAISMVCSGVAFAETRLNMANWLPPSHPLVAEVMIPYAEQISEATEGRVTVNVMPAPLGPPPAHYDFAVSGVADITFGVQAYTPGRFATSNLAELPLLGDTAEAISVAYWRTFDAFLRDAGEYDQVKVLSVFTHGPGQIFVADRTLEAAGDIAGAKLRVGGGIAHDVATSLGAVPIEGPSSQAYEMLSQGVADGIMFPFESIAFFNLSGLMQSGFEVPGGLYNTSFFVVMNKAKWEGLSTEDQAAIDSISGEVFARMAGQMWDRADAAGKTAMKGAVTISAASTQQLASIEAAVAPVVAERMSEIEAAGVDASAALDMLKAEIAAQ